MKRNQNLEKIRRESKIPTKKKDPLSNTVFVEPIDKRADLVVVMGDLNYRVEGLKQEELALAINERRYNVSSRGLSLRCSGRRTNWPRL